MPRVAVVTGANKGIGFHIAKLLIESKTQDVVYLTSRDEARGLEAVNALKKRGIDASFHQLDLGSQESVDRFADYLRENYGGLDVLVNNAGVCFGPNADASYAEEARATVETNFFGTLRVCEALVPMIREGGRIVHVSSELGHHSYREFSSALKGRFESSTLTVDELKLLISSFVTDVAENADVAKGWPKGRPWPSHAYGVSKIGVTVLGGLQQRDYDASHPGNDVIFSTCCPGLCDTDMTMDKGLTGPRPAEEGADVAFYLATLPSKSDSVRGSFWSNRKEVPWK